MRTFVALIRVTSFLLLLSLPCLMGCGGGGSSEPEAYTKDTGPPEEGMVWTDGVNGLPGSWGYPPSGGGGDAYDYESGYEDPPAGDNGGYADEEDRESGGSPDDVPDQGYSNDSDGGYGEGYGTDPYAPVKTSDEYADGNANDYGNADNIDRPDDLDERRAAAAARDRGNDGYGADAYASSDGGGGAAGGGSGVYKETIEPIFRAHCYNCHGGGRRGNKGGIDLHTPAAITAAGPSVVKQFDPDDSELFIRVSMSPGQENRMPPEGPGLSPEEVAAVKDWIQSGASFGAGGGNDGGYGGGNDPYANGGRAGRGSDDDPYDDREAAPARPKNLAEAASVTFRRGNDLEAMNQLYAQSLVRDSDAAKTVLESYRYLPAKRRATLAVRWGIGVVYKPLYGFEGSPRPPGVKQDIPNEDDDDSDEDGDEYAGMNFSNHALDYYVGDIGDEILVRLENRIGRSDYGEVLRAELDKALAGGDDDFDDDDYGDGYDGGGRRGGGYDGYGGGGGGGSSDKPDDDQVEQIMPGVMMLGQAEQSEIFKRAGEQEVDLVILIDIKTNPDRRRRLADSSFRVRLYDADARQLLATSGRIKNLDLQKKRAKDPDDETIINEVGKIFAVADAGKKEKDKVIRPYKVIDFPNTTSEKAKTSILNTVKRLISEPNTSPLAKLSEVRFYESRGLLKDTHAAAAFKKIAPEHAASLAKVVDENEIRTMLSDWLITDEPIGDEDEEAPKRRAKRSFR